MRAMGGETRGLFRRDPGGRRFPAPAFSDLTIDHRQQKQRNPTADRSDDDQGAARGFGSEELQGEQRGQAEKGPRQMTGEMMLH